MKVLVSTLMMLEDKQRFENILQKEGLELVFADVKQFLNEDQCISYSGKFDGWIAGDDEITKKVITKFMPRLKVISKWGTGVDSIDLKAAKQLGLPVFNSPGAFSEAVSEVAIGFMIDLSRKITETDFFVRSGKWPKNQTHGLLNKTIGIIGMGAIGNGVAKRLTGFGSNILYFDPWLEKKNINFNRSKDLNDLITSSDFICLTCNLTESNFHMFDMDQFRLMKEDAYIINVARGGLINTDSLIYALNNKLIAGAALDVYEQEPLNIDSPLCSMRNVILGSHNANNQRAAVEAVHETTIKNLLSILKP